MAWFSNAPEEKPCSACADKDKEIEALKKRRLELQDALRLLMNDHSSKEYNTGYHDGLKSAKEKYASDLAELAHLRAWRDGWKQKLFGPDFKP